MKSKLWFALCVPLLLALWITPALAQGPRPSGGGVHFGGNITIEPGTTASDTVLFGGNGVVRNGGAIGGSLLIFGGNLTIEQGGSVRGDVAVLGGNLEISGDVTGDISIAGGNVNLKPTAVVNGNVNIAGGNLNRSEGATVRGTVSQGNNPRINFTRVIPFVGSPRVFGGNFDFARGIVGALAMAALGALLVVFFPTSIQRVGATAQHSFLPSVGVGCLTLLVAPMLALLLVITIIGIPVLALLALVAVAAGYFGWITIGYLAGERILQALRVREIAPVLAVIVGVLLLAFIGEVPCLGPIVSFLIALLGLGAVILTRFGTRPYPYMPLLAPATPGTPPSAALPTPVEPSDVPPTTTGSSDA